MKVNIEEVIYEYSVRNKLDEDIPVYSVTNNKGFCTGYFSKDVASKDKSTYKIVPQGYFAYNPSRINVGSVDWQRYKEKVIVSPLYVVFGVLEKINQQYLFHYLKSDIILTYIKEYATGSVRDNLKLSELGKFPINLPPLDEQRHIAAVLDKVSDLIALRKKQLAKLDELVKARFVEMFGDPLTNKGENNKKPLGSIVQVVSSKRIFEKEYVRYGVPFYRTKEIVELSKGNNITTELFITKERYNEICKKYGCPQKGDLLISAVGTIGVIWIVDGKNDFYFKDGNLLRVEVSNHFNSIYLKFLLEELIKSYKIKMSVGTAYAALTIAELKKMMVCEVSVELQNQFADFVEEVEKQKTTIQRIIEKLEILKKSLMQKYFG